ncbi:MAG: 50S ribosomal protein L21 [Planctomycetota bacterium]|nr:50S ribosomal protein L21 [Planctomycetota bacterium]
MYAIIEDSGTQIKVSQGDVIKVALREMPTGTASLTFDRVLVVGGLDGEAPAKVGSPLLAGAKVTADVLGEGKNDRVVIRKFRRRKNYRRHRGHRQDFIKVKITGIEA